jgi:hypothetical protein
MTVSRWAARQAGHDPNTTADELIESANRLLYRQFISRGDPGGATHFDRIISNLEFFKDLFASFGFRFIFNDGWGYVGYVSPEAFNNTRVPTQETIVLLCLRLLYSEGAEKGYFIDSSADILVDEEEIQTVFASMGSRTLKSGELRAILIVLKRHGLITFDQSHSLHVSVEVTIRPTITEAIDASFLARLQAWAGQSGEQEPLGSINGTNYDSLAPETDAYNEAAVSPETAD